MPPLLLIAPPGALRDYLAAELDAPTLAPDEPLPDSPPAAIYLPDRDHPDPAEAARVAEAPVPHLVVVASGEIHPASHQHEGLLSEERLARRRQPNRVAERWRALEAAVADADARILTVLRPAPTPIAGGADFWSRLFAGRFAVVPAGYDPPLQILSPDDLAAAIRAVSAARRGGTFHVVPAGVVPLRAALRIAGVRRLPAPATLRRGAARDRWAYLRHAATISGEKIRQAVGFTAARSSVGALRRLRGDAPEPAAPEPRFDDFGLDKDYVAAYGRTLFRFLHDVFWRVEYRGLEHVPRAGRGILVGVHRGFMPWDGVMIFHLLVRELGRYPRFLIHPTLVKFPFLAPYMSKIGGVVACRENIDRVLSADKLVGIFPEGIEGAFRLYRDAYRLGRFGRGEFVKAALRNRAPIVPFVTVGSAEVFPIVARLRWRWWRRVAEWPCLPIMPNLGLVPLPSKWHTRFLEPIRLDRHPPEAAGDRALVRRLTAEVRDRMAAEMTRIRRDRRSIFYGSVFEGEPA